MSEFANAAQQAIDFLPYTMGFVIWTALVLSVGNHMGSSSSRTNSPYQDHKKVYESQLTMLKEPTETETGYAIREGEYDTDLLRIAKKDGQMYRQSRFPVYDEVLDDMADELSVLAVARNRDE